MAPPSLPTSASAEDTGSSTTTTITPIKALDGSGVGIGTINGGSDGGVSGGSGSKGWSSGSKMMVVPVSGSMKAGSGFDPIKWKAINPGPISSNYTRKSLPNTKTLNIRIIQDVADLCEAAVHLDFDPVGPCAALLPPKLLQILNTHTHVVALLHIKSSESQFTMLDLHAAELSHGAARRSADVDPVDKVSKLKEEFGSHVVVATETGWALTRLLVLNCQNPHMRRYVASRLLSQCGRWSLDHEKSGGSALKASLHELTRTLGPDNMHIMDFVLAGGEAGYTLIDVPYEGSGGDRDACYRVLVDMTHSDAISASAYSHTSPQPFRAFIVPLEAFTTNGQPLGVLGTDEVYDKRMWEEYLKEYTRLLYARAEAETLGGNAELRQMLLGVCDEYCRNFSFYPGHVTCVSSPTIWRMQDATDQLYACINKADKAYLEWLRGPSMACVDHDPIFQHAPPSLMRAAYQGRYLREPADGVSTQMGVAEIRDIGAVHSGIMVRSVPVLFGEVFADERHLYVTVAIAGIDAHHNASTRVKVYAEDISARGFMLTAETFEDSSINSVVISWVATTSPSIFMGQVKTDDPVLQWSAPNFHGPSLFPLPYQGPSVRRVDVPVSFPRRLEKPPAVWAGVHQLNLDRGRMRVRTRAVDVTDAGFTLAIETKDDTCLWEIGISWLATLDADVMVGKEAALGTIETPITSDTTLEARLPVPVCRKGNPEYNQDDRPAGSSEVVVTAITALTGIHALCDDKNARIWTCVELDRDNMWVVKGSTTLDGHVLQANIGTLFHTRSPVPPPKAMLVKPVDGAKVSQKQQQQQQQQQPQTPQSHLQGSQSHAPQQQQQQQQQQQGERYSTHQQQQQQQQRHQQEYHDRDESKGTPAVGRTSSWSLFSRVSGKKGSSSAKSSSSSCVSTSAVDPAAREPSQARKPAPPALRPSPAISTSDQSFAKIKSPGTDIKPAPATSATATTTPAAGNHLGVTPAPKEKGSTGASNGGSSKKKDLKAEQQLHGNVTDIQHTDVRVREEKRDTAREAKDVPTTASKPVKPVQGKEATKPLTATSTVQASSSSK